MHYLAFGELLRYLPFLAILVPIHLLVVSVPIYLIRRRNLGPEAGSWIKPAGKVVLLVVVVNVIALTPVALVGIIVWFVGLKRLSGLDVMSTIFLSIFLGMIYIAAMVLVTNALDVHLGFGSGR